MSEPIVYNKVCPVCKKSYQSSVRHQKYCSKACLDFAQIKVGKLKKRRRKRDLNRAFHRDWVRRHGIDRKMFIEANALIKCDSCGQMFHLKDIEIHHKNGNYLEGYPDHMDNLQGLCVKCHTKLEQEVRKSGSQNKEIELSFLNKKSKKTKKS